jgi:hypothetical protein
MYPNPLKDLTARTDQHHLAPKRFSPGYAVLVSITEYVLVLGAVANVYTAAFYTGSWTINTISCDTIYFQVLWSILTVPLHLVAVCALTLRVRDKAPRSENDSHWLFRLFRYEMQPCVMQSRLDLAQRNETYLFILVSWATSILSTTHVLWGTIAFSSVQFLGETH